MIRIATLEDIPGITEIYNQAIEAGFQTAFTEKVTTAERTDWLNKHNKDEYPVFVDSVDGQVVGWVSVSPYRPGRAALRSCVEVSYFVHRDHQKKGIGMRLLEHAIGACRELHYRSVLAIIIDRNSPSIKLMERAGFEKWGFLPRVFEFDGVICGHLYYGLTLE